MKADCVTCAHNDGTHCLWPVNFLKLPAVLRSPRAEEDWKVWRITPSLVQKVSESGCRAYEENQCLTCVHLLDGQCGWLRTCPEGSTKYPQSLHQAGLSDLLLPLPKSTIACAQWVRK